jgi:hypothetical protein
MYRMWTLLFGLSVAPLLFAQESKPATPQSQQEMRAIMSGSNKPCSGCGVVTNIRQSGALGQESKQDGISPLYETTRSGPVDNVRPNTLYSSDSKSHGSGKAAPIRWLVTVRYDDGSYSAFEQDDQPSVRKGDRIRVVSGRVEHR